ncbi:MAG: hypothetical protein LBI87_01960 [Candidatus Accumulibacter sp.]|jgi:hypothetical protein|nr:hypothetical protein [Accumulibacter sp.]
MGLKIPTMGLKIPVMRLKILAMRLRILVARLKVPAVCLKIPVIPAKAGIQSVHSSPKGCQFQRMRRCAPECTRWIPAFAGMTEYRDGRRAKDWNDRTKDWNGHRTRDWNDRHS